ncbi:hypothetical protein [Nocardiopsis sp. CNR-923]|uniref:hypothetical protein n=1 Tax=Nocardiopsis sp. CNR-923 TaxID=1904965 RepID=UPI0021CC5F2D|nr:hypothetical protein [Nocardiopsis sp. CNR-923]
MSAEPTTACDVTARGLRNQDRETVGDERAGRRLDLLTAVGAVLLVGLAVTVGRAIERADASLYVGWPPLYASWDPHSGPGSVPALALAAAVVACGPPAARILPWRDLVAAVWAVSALWTLALALVDGWRGFAQPLESPYEYLSSVDRFADVGAALRGFTEHILVGSPDNWPTHVAGHPPGAILTFVALDRVGLGGGVWAGLWCVVVGASAAAAVLVALRALGAEAAARRSAPFLVLFPGAVWIGSSADGYFAAAAAWGLALLAVAAAPAPAPPEPRRWRPDCCSAGRRTCPTGWCWSGSWR